MIEYSVADGVATVLLNDPETKNALGPDGNEELAQVFLRAETDDDCAVVVLRGANGAFCAGGNLRAVEGGHIEQTQLSTALQYSHTWVRLSRQMELMRKLVIAAVDGPAHAGGFALVLAADLSIATARSSFRFPEASRGLADFYAAVRLPEYVGLAMAKELLYTCRRLDAAEAAELRLINAVVADDDLDAELAKLIARVRTSSPYAVGLTKEGIHRRLMDYDARLHLKSIMSPDAPEGIAAFFERRRPSWDPGQ